MTRIITRLVQILAVVYVWTILSVNVPLGHKPLVMACSYAILLALILLMKRESWQKLIRKGLSESSAAESNNGRWAWPLAGIGVLAVAITILELRQPYFFVQDDNFVSAPGFSNILYGCRSLLEGVFCTWNPYQLLGAPTSSMPQSTLTYPGTYIAYLLSRYLLGNEYFVLDVFCIMHIALGFLAMYAAARSLGLRPMLACIGSLSFLLSGYTLILGRSWALVIPVILWGPLTVLAIIRLQCRPVSWKWVAATGLVIGLFFHAGYVQTWAYLLLFLGLALGTLVWAKSLSVSRAMWILPAVLLALALAAPVLTAQVLEAVHLYGNREVGDPGDGIQRGALNLLFPHPLSPYPGRFTSSGYGPDRWGTAGYNLIGQFYYSGTLFYLVGFLVLVSLIVYRWDRRVMAANIWLFLAGIAVLFALGREGGLWVLLAKLPMFNKFTGPFKFLVYLNLFIILGCGLVIERLLRGLRHARLWELGMGIAVTALLLYHCALPLPSFYSYGDKPYPPLPTEMASLLPVDGNPAPRRVFPIVPARGTAPGYAQSLMHNFPTIYGILSLMGYDPLVWWTPENGLLDRMFATKQRVDLLREYGVRWVIVSRLVQDPVMGPNERWWPSESNWDQDGLPPVLLSAQPRLVLPEVTIWELSGSRPMAFAASQPTRDLPITLNGAGVRVDVSRLTNGGDVIVNFLKRPWSKAYADGRGIACSSDEWGRMQTHIPAGTKVLEVRYSPPWGLGFRVGGLLAFLSAAITWGLTAWDRRRPQASD